jgi:hypothetical protein
MPNDFNFALTFHMANSYITSTRSKSKYHTRRNKLHYDLYKFSWWNIFHIQSIFIYLIYRIRWVCAPHTMTWPTALPSMYIVTLRRRPCSTATNYVSGIPLCSVVSSVPWDMSYHVPMFNLTKMFIRAQNFKFLQLN